MAHGGVSKNRPSQQPDMPEPSANQRAANDRVGADEATLRTIKEAINNRLSELAQPAFARARQLPEPARFDMMCVALRSPNLIVAGLAAEALESYNEEAAPTLLDALPDSHDMVKLRIVKALGRSGSENAVEPLLDFLETAGSPSLCYTIIEALGMLGDSRAIAPIEGYVDHDDHHVRERAEQALKRLQAPS